MIVVDDGYGLTGWVFIDITDTTSIQLATDASGVCVLNRNVLDYGDVSTRVQFYTPFLLNKIDFLTHTEPYSQD